VLNRRIFLASNILVFLSNSLYAESRLPFFIKISISLARHSAIIFLFLFLDLMFLYFKKDLSKSLYTS